MARIKLDFPDKVLGTVEIPLRITDMNYGNHLGNDALVSILHEARVKWLNSMNYTELNVEGAGLIMGELVVSYLNESFYGDVLTVQLAAGDITGAGFELYYLVETNRNGKTINIAKARTGMVCFDYSTRKVIPIPEKFSVLLQQ
jgi:acyl-CoA thioester hydrolase